MRPWNIAPIGQAPDNFAPDRRVPVNRARDRRAPINMAPGFRPPINMDRDERVMVNMAPNGQVQLNFAPGGRVPVQWMAGGRMPVNMAPYGPPPVNMAPYGPPPVNMAPLGQPLVNLAPYGQLPFNMAPYGQPPVNMAPYGQPPVNMAPYGQPPVNMAPYEQPPVDMAPYGHPPVNMAPYGQPPVNMAPYGQPPINMAPYGQPPLDIGIEGPPPVNLNLEGQPLVNFDPEEQPPVHLDAEGQPPVNLDAEGQPPVNLDAEGQPPVNLDPEGQAPANMDPEGQPPANMGPEQPNDAVPGWQVPADYQPEDNGQPVSPAPNFDHPEFPHEEDLVYVRCTGREECLCPGCRFLRLPTEIFLHLFSYLSQSELMVAKVAFASCQRLQQALKAVWFKCEELDVAILEDITMSPSGVLEDMIASMPMLRSIWCSTNRRSLRNSISPATMYESCRHLTKIDLNVVQYALTSAAELCRRYPGLLVVRMPSQYENEDLQTLLAGLPELQSLETGSEREAGQSFHMLPTSLRRLSLTRCRSLQSWGLRMVARCSQLRELELYERVGEAQLAFNRRERFSPFNNISICESRISVEDWAALLEGCPHLEHLALAGGFVLTPPHLNEMTEQRCRALRHLDLSRVQHMGTSGLQLWDMLYVITACPSLQRLTMQTMADIHTLDRWVSTEYTFCISYLDVSGSTLSNKFVAEINRMMPFLETLRMRECTGITSGVMYYFIARLQILQELDIRGTSGVNDTALLKLERCPRLSELWLRPGPGQCTMEGIAGLVHYLETLTKLNLDLRRAEWSMGTIVVDLGLLLRDLFYERDFTLAVHARVLEHLEKPLATGKQRLQLMYEPDRYPAYDSDSTSSPTDSDSADSPTGSVEDLDVAELADEVGNRVNI